MSVQENKSTLTRAAEAFNDPSDRSAWFDIHDPSVVAHGLGPNPLDLEGLEHFYGGLWKAFPDLQITVDDMVGEGDRVSWRLRVRGTQEAEFRGVPPTGKEVTFGAQYIFRFRDGRIVERWTNFDRLGVLVQLGAIPAPI
ncbi:MAG: ester cyclase [Gemmatimonadetes bacterium]|nr:ester cyclase [Gemmatimonadota bacterium]